MTLGGTAQLATAHCPNERTLDPQSAAITDPPMPQPAALWPSPRNVLRQRLTIFSGKYYHILIATHIYLPRRDGRLSWPRWLITSQMFYQPTSSPSSNPSSNRAQCPLTTMTQANTRHHQLVKFTTERAKCVMPAWSLLSYILDFYRAMH